MRLSKSVFYIRCDIAVACVDLRNDALAISGACESVGTRALLRATLLLILPALDMQECLNSVSNAHSKYSIVEGKKLCISLISKCIGIYTYDYECIR